MQSSTGEPIQVFEVQVFNTSCVNIAKTATQSSTYKEYVASYAVDRDNTTYSHTATASRSRKASQLPANDWLEIDLEENVQVCSIGIQNRWCKNENDSRKCLCKLSGVSLVLINELGSVIPDTPVSLNNTCDQSNIKIHFDNNAAFCTVSAFSTNNVPSGQHTPMSWHSRVLRRRPTKC